MGKLAWLNQFLKFGDWLAAIAAGLLLAAAFPRVDFAGGAWAAPALLVFAARNKRGWGTFRIGFAAGLVFWLLSLDWLLEIPYRWHSLPLGPAAGWLALCGVLALFLGAWVWLVSNPSAQIAGSWPGRWLWAIAGGASWVALEMIRARVLGGFPWNFLGVSQFRMVPLIQIASVTGVYGISFLVVWTSLSFYSAGRMILSRPHSRFAWEAEVFFPLLVVAGLFALGEIKVNQSPSTRRGSTTGMLRVALVQPSIPQNLIWDENANSNRFEELLAQSETALTHQADLLVWPESAVPEFDDATYAAIRHFVRAHGVWLIFNADDVEPRPQAANEYDNDVFNAAFLMDPNGNVAGIYHKQKLVMFGEYVPWASWLPFAKWLTPITGSYTPGHSTAQFYLEDFHAAASPLICFEDLFPQLARKAADGGADILVNLTNDGWFGQSAEQWQHETSAIFRAVENGIPLVRCCNNGITCWIDAEGRPREIFRDKSGSVYGEGAMVFDLPLERHEPTFYTRHGDCFGWSCVGIALVLCSFRALTEKLKR